MATVFSTAEKPAVAKKKRDQRRTGEPKFSVNGASAGHPEWQDTVRKCRHVAPQGTKQRWE